MNLEGGIPSKRGSLTRVDYVPALCTHRPSLLPISSGPVNLLDCDYSSSYGKLSKPYHLEEGEVVTRFP